MKKPILLYITTLILIPILVISIIYKSLDKKELENNKITTVINTTYTTNITKNTNISTTKETNKNNIKINVNKNNELLSLDLEDYIVGVVAGEMPASFNIEALKAQAVASRTYAMYKVVNNNNNLESTTDDQVYITKEEMQQKWENEFNEYYQKIEKAVKETESMVMKKDGKIFKSFYFAMSNGYTEDSQAVFGENNIESVSSPWDNESVNKFLVETSFTNEQLKSLLNLNEDIQDIKILSKDKTNRVSKLSVNNKTFTGIEFRKLLTLRSTDFEIKKDNNSFIITTKGYGHGVGMSQYGANGMAKDNYKYNEILEYYYKNIKLEKI